MEDNGRRIGQVAARTGLSRKALRFYEAAGVLPRARRSATGYRLYGRDAEAIIAFVVQARRLGFRLVEIKEMVAIRRAGGTPCAHVRALVRRKLSDIDRALSELGAMRSKLRSLERATRARRTQHQAVVCPCIEAPDTGEPAADHRPGRR